MICGDDPFDYFPYRSSSYLTRFFEDLDLDYTHDGSTRRHWVKGVLSELNQLPSGNDEIPSREMVKIIEYLLHPDHFLGEESTDQQKAINAVNEALKAYELSVVQDKATNTVRLHSALGEFASSATEKKNPTKVITFCPEVFEIPSNPPQDHLISIMMPFRAEFDEVFEAARNSCASLGLGLMRADNLWNNSTFIQDIFELIYCSKVVIVDFTGKNPNVMYETGVAHTLGKHVIPITQSLDDVPSDIRHHRALKYLPNSQGLVPRPANT